ncbi:NAD(P)-dependent dehydrogenase (short-subunit alcohol dehydrogenase family) [Silvimonas terrae]|uniref:NAD(P)-dependent dehydrogenase (Short-subunit alcohol dehydrogenase family) n=1 Tax=Silvimonas terrae TaxID=300266 RepID=A0A840RI48_9NEIS|nr:SDR family oxidoreductase [Silvimonas terrae]MBB5193339.1 NAD(P)-dependent dehydrogenase (short-subunit alcohol dehydrogenase family) [Silvimonas terrae]
MTQVTSNTQVAKVAIVTGGSRGLGRSTVLALAKRGVHSILTWNRASQEAEAVVAEAAALGVKTVALQLDTGNTAAFDGFVAQINTALAQLGVSCFDYLVNNAGTSHHASIQNTTEAELDALYNVHVKGVFFLTQKLLPLMNDGGRIVNISSGLTRFSVPESGPYAAMKGAVEVLTRYLAKELGPRGITANTVAPGAIQTDFSGGVVRDNPQVNQMVSSMTALGRPGVADDIGPMIAALLSDDNRWVNGQRIEVSGGMVL